MTTLDGPEDQRRADIMVCMGGTTWLVDVGVVCPGTPRLIAKGADVTPGRAAAVYSTIKEAKYGDQNNFVPFIVETGGRINAAGLEFFDKVSGALEADTARVRAARRAALCGVAASLVKQQGYMLAQIVTEINAPDLAAGDVGGAGVVAEGNDGDAIFGSVHHHAEDADYVD